MKATFLALPALLAIAACGVPKDKYDISVRDAQKAKVELNQAIIEQNQQKDELTRLRASLDDLDAQCADRARKLADQKSALSASLQDSQARIDELKRNKAAAEARAAMFHDLADKLKHQLDDGQLSLIVRDGRMVLALPNDVLLDTGRTDIKPAATNTLKAVAAVIKLYPKRQFQVAGHTDNVPIHTERFASNWELSSGRALEVVHFLAAQGVRPAQLSTAGYADVDPVAANDTDANKRRNRRLEITLQPNIDDLVYVPPR